MKRSKMLASVLIFVLCFTVVLSGCGTAGTAGQGDTSKAVTVAASTTEKTAEETTVKEAEPVSMRVMVGTGTTEEGWGKTFKDLVDKFNADNKFNATLNLEPIDVEQYATKIAAELATNNCPDIFYTWAAGRLKAFVGSGKLVAFNDILDKDSEWKSRFLPGMFDSVTFDGKIYAVPGEQNAAALFYNTEIFQKYGLQPPQSYADLKNVIKVLNKNNIVPLAMGNQDPWVGAILCEYIFNRMGGNEPFDKIAAGTGTFEDASYIEGGKVLQELVSLNAFPKGFNGMSYADGNNLFTRGKAGMICMGSWIVSEIYGKDSLVKDKVDVMKFPTLDNGKGNLDTWLGQPDLCLAISQNCKNIDAAAEFIKSFSATEAQKAFAESTGSIPVTVADVDMSKCNPLTAKLRDLQKTRSSMFIFYDVALGNTIGGEFNNVTQNIFAGKSPADEFKKLTQFVTDNSGK